jgi:hypothetical protein
VRTSSQRCQTALLDVGVAFKQKLNARIAVARRAILPAIIDIDVCFFPRDEQFLSNSDD